VNPLGGDLVEDTLLRWRRRALYAVLGLVVVAGLPSYVFTIWNAVQLGEVTPLLFVYTAVYLAFVALVGYPRLNFNLRAWIFILVAYANGAASLARLGLVGSGRLYLITIPVVATMVAGARAGYLTAGLSLVIYVAFTWLAHAGLLAGVAIPPEDPTTFRYWSEAGAALVVFLVLLVALVERFHGLQIRALAARREPIDRLEQAGAALKEREEREERLALVTQGINDGIWDWDLKSNQVYFSPRWKAMLGYQEHGIPHRFDAWRALLHPDDVGRAEAAIQAHLDGQTSSYRLEHRLRHKDGSYRWILARGVCLRDAGGQPYRMAGSHTDITERKQADEALRSSEAELRALLSAMTDVMFVLDGQGRYLKIPPTNPALLYRPPAELLGKTLHEVFPQAQADLFLANIRRALATRQPVRFEYNLPIGGTPVWFDATLSPMLDEAVVWVARDISERKSIEEALQAAYQDMERRVAERTHELVTLNAIAALVNRSLDLQDILHDALAKTMEVLDLEGGGAYCLADNGETLLLLAQRGLSDTLVRRTSRLPLQVALAGQPIHQDVPIVWQVADYPQPEVRQLLEAEGIQVVVGLPLMVKSTLLGGLILNTRRPRVLRPEELSLLVAVGQQVALAVENARLYQREHEGHEEAERRQEVAEGLYQILTVLNSRQSLDDTLDFIVKQACRLLGSDAASISQLQAEAGILTVQAASGLEPEDASSIKIPVGQAADGRAVAQRIPVPVADSLAALARLEREGPLPPEPQWALLRRLAERYRAWLSVPVVVKDEDYGAISLYYHQSRQFSAEEIRLALSVADQAALAIESARLHDQARQMAAMTERSRLARELHDSVTQSLYSITLYAEAAARLLAAGEPNKAIDHLGELRDTAQEALREMRLLIFELRPLALEKSGLAAALQARLEAVEGRGGIQTELQVEGVERLPGVAQEELYHIARESLNNVLKHANARRVAVRLHFGEKLTRLAVCDDGTGFVPGSAGEHGGIGLAGMKERADRIGGHLRIESAPGAGTIVRVEVPLATRDGHAAETSPAHNRLEA